MKNVLGLIVFAFIISCTSEDSVNNFVIGEKTFTPSFNKSLLTIEEGNSSEVIINFNRRIEQTGFIEIDISESNGIIGEDFNSDPLPDENLIITLPVVAGDSSLSISVTALPDSDSDLEELVFTISDASDFINTNNSSITIKLTDLSTDPSETLKVVTWNIEFFPKEGTTTINKVADIIEYIDADVIALQEIADENAFNQLDNILTDWEGRFSDVRYGQDIAFLFKSSEISAISSLSQIYNTDSDAFPREPVLVTVTHKSGMEVTFICIHLKCCGSTGSDEANRRADASLKLESYVNANLPTKNVVILGDWNDDINDGPFDNFIVNDANYAFADMSIAIGSSAYWSYPFSSTYLSHLDHILITNELFDNLIGAETLRVDLDFSNYEQDVSDHRPVSATFGN